MRELSLNILDIAQNSITAGANRIEIRITADTAKDYMEISVEDNGKGMSKEFLSRIEDPFTTTRTTRKVGMGIPLFKYSCESAGGKFKIESEIGKGTLVSAGYKISHIDRMPLGDISGTMITLISMAENVDFLLSVTVDGESGELDTAKMREILGGDISLSSPEILEYIREYIKENITVLYGGKI